MEKSNQSSSSGFTVDASAVISQSPVVLSSPGRDHELQVRVSAPVTGNNLPIILFSHGFGSSMDAYVYVMEMLTTLFRAKLTTGLADF